ncbi:MAG: DUF1461 domain-containing protein [Gemella sp.]|nr:DUF1461 domain-containing protein [Gemella sp.]
MKKFLLNLLVIIQLISFFIASIFFIVLKVSFIFDLYKYFYTKVNLAWKLDISDSLLLNYTDNLLTYLKTGAPLDTTWYTEKDILHMIDVRDLYQNSLTITYILFSIFLITSFIIFLLEKKNTMIFISKSFPKVFILFIALMLILGIYIAIDFNSFWINFHLLVFDNDLWLLSPLESNLIKMFPEEFFLLLVTICIISIVLFFIFLFGIMKILKNKF